MDMIRHYNIVTNKPGRGVAPGTNDRGMNLRRCQYCAAPLSTCRHINYDRPIMLLRWGQVNRMLTISYRRDTRPGVPLRDNRTRGSASLREDRIASHSQFAAIRRVISTASSSAAAACEPETFGSPPVSAQSTKEVSCCRNGSSFSIATGSRAICPFTRR
jgi:hypothetical protein